jgi:hypothetical protein
MKKKLVLPAMLVCLLAVGLAFVACDDGSTNGSQDAALNGTWVMVNDDIWIFDNGDLETSKNPYRPSGLKIKMRLH